MSWISSEKHFAESPEKTTEELPKFLFQEISLSFPAFLPSYNFQNLDWMESTPEYFPARFRIGNF